MSDRLAAGVRITPAEADEKVAAAERRVMDADRARVAAEAELATLSVRLNATKDALLMSEGRVTSMESEKRAVEARLRMVQEDCTRLESQLVAAQSMRATADEMIEHIRSNAANTQHAITSVSATRGDAPTFELSFTRDSTGRIKSPVTAKPRA